MIPEGLKLIAGFSTLTLDSNHFLPDDMAAFIGGYGTNNNGWTKETRIRSLTTSPQTPPHPMGDTLFFSVLEPYIDGLVYNDTAYTAQYEFIPSTGTPIVQGSSRLSNPLEDTYSLKTTLRNAGYADIADMLVFTTEVTVVYSGGGSSAERKLKARLPSDFSLEQNYPNPYNPTTTIRYSLPQDSEVTLRIYDLLGREVAELVNNRQTVGSYTVELNSTSWASGLYIYRLRAGSSFIQTKTMFLIK